jgi:hypothetical protein
MVIHSHQNLDDLDELELKKMYAYLGETLGFFDNFLKHKDDLPDEVKGTIITIEERIAILQDALEQDASGDLDVSSDVEDPVEFVKKVGQRSRNLDFENMDHKWLSNE